MAFIQNPLLRQRWNHISQTTETVTENAAAGIWTFQHRYINPCLASAADALDACTLSLCMGDREERARRARERDRGARRGRAAAVAPEYTFDFYDDWADDFPEDDFEDDGGGEAGGGGGERTGILGRITGDDWDRLLAGTGGGGRRREEGEVLEQPRRKRGMSYGTRGAGRRKVSQEDDPTVIPSTAPLGFLGRLPFRFGGTLRYKPSAANLKEHPGQHAAREGLGHEREPLLGTVEDEEPAEDRGESRGEERNSRQRSSTAGSGATSDSYRSRNDLFPSDGEGDEDAVPLDDEFAVALDRVDDRGSNKTRSSKGKRVEGRSNSGLSLNLAKTVSRTTIGSTLLRDSKGRNSVTSMRQLDGPAEVATPTMEDLLNEEEQARREEEEEVESKRRRAAQAALELGLSRGELAAAADSDPEQKADAMHTDALLAEPRDIKDAVPEEQGLKVTNGTRFDMDSNPVAAISDQLAAEVKKPPADFVPARLPYFQ